MVAPLVAVAGASAIGGLLISRSNYRATKRLTDYQEGFYNGYRSENARFFRDYRKAHHWNSNRTVRYGYRTGYYYNLSSLYSARLRAVSSKNAVYRSAIGGLAPFGLLRSSGQYGFRTMSPHYMYG